MTDARRTLLARAALLAFTLGCAAWLLQLDHGRKISTDVLDLIPAAEQAPELAIVRGFASNVQSRVMLFALRDRAAPETPPTPAARTFAQILAASPQFAEAVVVGDEAANDALGRAVFEHRFEWLLPTWLGERARAFAASGQPEEAFPSWLAERVTAELESFLVRPEAAALQELIPRDPLLLVPSLVERARLLGAPGAAASGHALIWARIAPSPFAEEGQDPVFAVVERAIAAVQPGGATTAIDVRWTGVNRFAAASRARIEAEIALLNTCSIAAVLAVSCLFVRRIHRLLHLVPIILLSIAGAWTLSTMVFDRLHILVFVIGSLLSGVAVDYGFYIYMQPLRRPDEPYGERLRRILKPLLASCLTTVIGFSLLLFSELPLIRQIGVFVSAGLLCALGAAMLYFAQLERPLLEGRSYGVLDQRREPPWVRSMLRVVFVLLALVAVVGPMRLTWRDDVRELDLPARELQANEIALRALFGESPQRAIFLTYGSTLPEARARLDAFLDHQRRTMPGVTAASTGLLLPTGTDWQEFPERLARLQGLAPALTAALTARGFEAEAFTPFFAAWAELQSNPPGGDYRDLVATLREALRGPLALMSNTVEPPFWFLTVVERTPAEPPPAELHTIGLNRLQSLNVLFTRYRWSALRLSSVGLGLVILSVFLIYPPRPGLRIALIPAGSCFFVFGLLGFAGQALNLFHLLGAFLGVCLSHNYAIFSSENAAAGTAPPVPVRLSAFCTAASFGVLGFSRIPVIHALGLTVTLIVLTTLAVVELESLVRRPRA